MNPIHLALLNLRRHPGNTLIGLLAIGLAVGIGGLLLRLHHVGADRFGNMVRSGDAIVGAKSGELDILLNAMNLEGDYPDFFTSRLYWSLQNRHRLEFMENPDYVTGLVPIVYCAKYRGARVIGTNDDFLRQPGLAVSFDQGAWVGQDRNIVLGANVARQHNLRVGDKISVDPWTGSAPGASSIFTYEFTVSGILQPLDNRWDGALFIGMAQARTILERSHVAINSPWGSDVLHYVIVHLKPGGYPGLRNLINQMTITQAVSVPQAMDELQRLTGGSRTLALAAMFLALILGSLCVAGLFGGRFEVLSGELAILRALGYSRGETSARLLWEAILLGGAACLLGAVLDFSFFGLFQQWMTANLSGPAIPYIPAWRSYPVWLLAMGATVISASLPLYRLYRQDAHNTLRRSS